MKFMKVQWNCIGSCNQPTAKTPFLPFQILLTVLWIFLLIKPWHCLRICCEKHFKTAAAHVWRRLCLCTFSLAFFAYAFNFVFWVFVCGVMLHSRSKLSRPKDFGGISPNVLSASAIWLHQTPSIIKKILDRFAARSAIISVSSNNLSIY